ncbi:hypothetical protein [Xanthomonas sacchari]|uniref:hypothetical protein n=1 Tax=Xanthomonas sacchari TaxID=56458 RepID=UPI00224D035C|nr:hypothetical protein [Xanthomonas sacchari]UYK74739.1 hypothetical protein NG828_10725 [Xanthomonas sacchari]
MLDPLDDFPVQFISACMAAVGILALGLLVRGIVALLRWDDRRFAQQLDADFRAHVMVEEAKREVSRRA